MQISRRQFLKNGCLAGVSLSLTSALRPATVVQLCPHDISWGPLENQQLWELVRGGTAPLWVAGHTLNSFAHHLRFINLRPELITYLQKAGGEWKSFLQAKGLWETIPPQIRAGGRSEILHFLGDKDWSHRIPRSLGGPTTPENGIFELRLLNRMRGARTMTRGEIAAANAVIRSDVIVSVARQTLGAMVNGAIIGVIVSGLIACLECGLLYADGEITWDEMITEIMRRTLLAGGLSFIITGLLVGLGLLFPGLIPLLVAPMFVMQIAGLVFLAQYAVGLGKRYGESFEEHSLIFEACQVLRVAEEKLRETVDEFEKSIAERIREWLRSITIRILRKRTDPAIVEFHNITGKDRVWVWLATQTDVVSRYASDTVSPLRMRGYAIDDQNILRALDLPELNMPEINSSIEELERWIAWTVYCEFKKAICAAIKLREYLRTCSERTDWKLSTISRVVIDPTDRWCNTFPVVFR